MKETTVWVKIQSIKPVGNVKLVIVVRSWAFVPPPVIDVANIDVAEVERYLSGIRLWDTEPWI